jgi:RimJ/RimL family protein N-acetyltransferase/8-oxo-dGTP pyrophosphatase MutT (NUDIX family)
MIELAQPTLTTPRLTLRPWHEADLPQFATMNADPRVMRHFPKTLTRGESAAAITRLMDHFHRHAFGIFAVEETATATLIGSVGLTHPLFESHFTPCVEIGWRIAHPHQGRGYATEAARAALEFGFQKLQLAEIVSFTVPANEPSWMLMERLGMTRSEVDDFAHPKVPKDHPLSRHILYRLTRSQWQEHNSKIFAPTPQIQYGRCLEGRSYIARPGSYAIIKNSHDQFAIIQTSGGIGLPGGGANPGETPEQTLHRELLEETGRPVIIHRQIGHTIDFIHSNSLSLNFEKHCTFFRVSFDPRAPSSRPEPGTEIIWLTPHDAIAVLTHESHRWAVAQLCT